MNLIIVRHGESVENTKNILQGLLPGKLSKTGKVQSTKLGKYLSQEKIDVIYCSPIFRCLETLKYIKKNIDSNIPIYISSLIQERDFGEISGQELKNINFDNLDKDSEENKVLGIESLKQVNRRSEKFLNEIIIKHPNKTVLVISHSNPLRMFFAILLHKSFYEILDKYKINNASISRFNIDKDITPLILNQTDFLD